MVWVITPQQKIDPDAFDYLARVEAADGQALESGVRTAVDNFVRGCKSDGIWYAIRAGCILAGARTRQGAIIPFANESGTAPSFVGTAGDWSYDRKIGLKANGTNNGINSGRTNNRDQQNNKHAAVYVTEAHGSVGAIAPTYIGAGTSAANDLFIGCSVNNGTLRFSLNDSNLTDTSLSRSTTGLIGASRSSSSGFTRFPGGSTVSAASGPPSSFAIGIFSSFVDAGARNENFTNARIAFYSIGESINLSLLNTRVATLLSAFAAAIP